jgi:transcriptional antiterminator RfaH
MSVAESGLLWSAVQVRCGQEDRAVDNLKRQEFVALFPFFMERPPKGGPVAKPLFPGYVFVELLVGQPWAAINSTYGVIRLLASRFGTPHRLPEEFVTSLQRRLVPNPSGRGAYCLAEGTVVRADTGPFAGQSAIVEWSAADRLGLLFSLFNREVKIEFALADVTVQEAAGV